METGDGHDGDCLAEVGVGVGGGGFMRFEKVWSVGGLGEC